MAMVNARGLSLVVVSGATLELRGWVFHCGGFSCCRAQALGARALVAVPHGLSYFTACGVFPEQLFHSMWDLPRTVTEPASPALQDGYLTTRPRGKPF